MKISQLFTQKRTVFSIEVFPPRPNLSLDSIEPALKRLALLRPDFISVTYSAGGGANKRTAEIAKTIKTKYDIEPLAHLTCINSNLNDIDSELEKLNEYGIQNILALRGDKIANSAGAFTYASELAAYIKSKGSFDVGGACYPEGHHESPSINEDIKNLKIKCQNGANFLLSQLFFDNEDFFTFTDKCALVGIDAPISAGIMPLVKKSQVERILTLTGAKIPKKLSRLLARFSNDEESLMQAGISYATDQIIDLLSFGVSGIHLYCMNNADVGEKIINNIKGALNTINAKV